MGRIRRGDIVVVNFEPVRGSEQGGIRPALVIQNNGGNLYGPTIIVAAITSKNPDKNYPFNVHISKNESSLFKDSIIMLNQIRTIDKSRIGKKISQLNPYIMFQVDLAIKISLGLEI
jgi:mRNA interferase MazF